MNKCNGFNTVLCFYISRVFYHRNRICEIYLWYPVIVEAREVIKVENCADGDKKTRLNDKLSTIESSDTQFQIIYEMNESFELQEN